MEIEKKENRSRNRYLKQFLMIIYIYKIKMKPNYSSRLIFKTNKIILSLFLDKQISIINR